MVTRNSVIHFGFPRKKKNLYKVIFHRVCHIIRQSRSPWFNHPNNIRRRLPIMTLFYCVIFCKLLLPPPLPRHDILEYPQPILLPSLWQTDRQTDRITRIESNRKNYVLFIFIFTSLYSSHWDLPHWKITHRKKISPDTRFNSWGFAESLVWDSCPYSRPRYTCADTPWGDKTKQV